METPSSITLRPILPRPSATPVPTPPAPKPITDLAIPRKTKVISACQACKLKKIKCDGDRPECGPCKSKGRDCDYPVQGNRAEILVRRQQALQENVESFGALYRYLQERPAHEASSLFDRIRDGVGIEAALEFVKREDSTSALTCKDPPSARVEWSQRIYDCNLLFENELLSTETSDVAIQALRDGVDCYFSYLGTMFPIYTRKEADSIIDSFLASREGRPDQVVSKKVAYGELLAICALGFQYDRQTLPNGNASICTPFYQKARLFLDYVVEKAPLRAMRICCCLGIYNVIAKSSLAISYTDWGILLGSSSGLAVGKRPATFSETEFNGYTRTFAALITVRSWVTATLGHIPSPEVSRCIHETREKMDNTGDLDSAGEDPVIGILQQKMAQITVLKANVLRTVASFRVLSPAILRQMHEDLELWRTNLPAYMRLETLVHTPEISPDQRRVTFYMHLFYMSALILKTRALLATQKDIAACTWDPEATAAIFEGIHAARNSARLLGLIHEEKAVVKNCWLTIYQCYVTFLMLNFTAIKSFLVGGEAAFRQQDIVLSRTCIEILALCATKDKIARSFHTRLRTYRDTINEHLPEVRGTSKDSGSYEDGSFDDDSYLFVESSGDTRLHHLIYELRELLCYPLTLLKGSEASIPYPTIVEASVNADIDFAHHLASPFNMAEDELPSGLFPPDESLEGSHNYDGETEGYLSGSVPFGWDISAWRRDPGVGSSDNT
ncbi:nitrate assimilation regulatory nirA [Fusarium coicis]|nr:nitrate assimilation regulatory nirA [Fusarium coicis]